MHLFVLWPKRALNQDSGARKNPELLSIHPHFFPLLERCTVYAPTGCCSFSSMSFFPFGLAHLAALLVTQVDPGAPVLRAGQVRLQVPAVLQASHQRMVRLRPKGRKSELFF